MKDTTVIHAEMEQLRKDIVKSLADGAEMVKQRQKQLKADVKGTPGQRAMAIHSAQIMKKLIDVTGVAVEVLVKPEESKGD